MDQVSRPMQIALLGVVLLAAMWFAVLRPKAGSGGSSTPAAASAPAAPGTKGLGSAVDKAKGAVATSQASATASEKAAAKVGDDGVATAGATATATKAAATATKAPAAKATTTGAAKAKASTPAVDPSGKLLNTLAHGKTIVLLFAGEGADDQAARQAVSRLARSDHRIVAKVAPITQVGNYEAITTGIQVLTSPTVVVIGKDRKAASVTGYTDPAVLAQMVGDVRRDAAKSGK